MSIRMGDITAVILAGGQGRRMGGRDKGLIDFNGKPLVEILLDKLRRQPVSILINANRNRERYAGYGYPVVSDQLEDYQGPLAGFASAMAAVETDYILTLPCDSPLLIDDYVERFIAAQADAGSAINVAFDGDRLQPVHALLHVGLLPSLQAFLESGERKIDRWYDQHDYNQVDFSDCPKMFRNINSPDDHLVMEANS